MANASSEATLMVLAAQAAPHAVIVDICMIGGKFHREPVAFSEEDGNLHSSFSFKVEHDYDTNDKKLTVIVHFLSRGELGEGEERRRVYQAEASFLVTYMVRGDEVLPNENADAFAKLNGVYNCWPFFREFLQNATLRMALPPVVLPLITGAAIQDILVKQAVVDATKPTDEPASSVGSGA